MPKQNGYSVDKNQFNGRGGKKATKSDKPKTRGMNKDKGHRQSGQSGHR